MYYCLVFESQTRGYKPNPISREKISYFRVKYWKNGLAQEIQLGHKNKGNDHQLKKLLMVKQILLVST